MALTLHTYMAPLGSTAIALAPMIELAGVMEATSPLAVATVRTPPCVTSASAHQPPAGAHAMPCVVPCPARVPRPSMTIKAPRPDTVVTMLGAPGAMRRRLNSV
jgi:hypothetical protein